MSGLKLPGSFSTFSVASLTDVGTGLVDTVTTTVTEVTRTAATDSQAFTYYIRADYNINGNISYTPSSATGGLDDAWGMSAIAITKDNASGASVVLPSGSKSIDAGLITIKEGDAESTTAGTFAATLVLALSSAGLLTVTSLSITGSDVTVTEAENNLLAQYLEIGPLPGTTSNASNVTTTSADNLSDTVTASDVTSAYSTQISTIEGYYNNVTVLTDWAISVSAVTSSTNNALAQHARNLTRTSTAVFSENALVVASTPSTYTVAVNDYTGTSQQIATGSVYGVVRQTATGAAIDP
jgi:hypothetical protein